MNQYVAQSILLANALGVITIGFYTIFTYTSIELPIFYKVALILMFSLQYGIALLGKALINGTVK